MPTYNPDNLHPNKLGHSLIANNDSVHINNDGGLVVATGIKDKLLSLGYINNTWLAS